MAAVKKFASADYQVFGKVQGVFFRKYTKLEADRLGVVGWVMNSADGESVVGTVQGAEEKMRIMKSWLETKGSKHSRIDKAVFTNERTIKATEFSDFKIKH